MSLINNDLHTNELGRRMSMDTDDAFHAEIPKIISLDSNLSVTDSASASKSDPTFIQNQLSLPRVPSTVGSHNSSLSHQLSVKSNASQNPGLARHGSIKSVTDGVKTCSLSKSISMSARSMESVQSVTAVGTHPFGSLRVHSNNKQQGEFHPDCLLSGDVVIVTGMPPGSIFGFDTVSFTLGKKGHFEGLRDLPFGPHFIYGGSSSELSTRTGFWIMSSRRAFDEHGDVFVKRWDNYSETLEDELSVAEVRIQHERVPEIFNSLMPYTTKAINTKAHSGMARATQSTNYPGVDDPHIWSRLTFAIKGAMLTRITGQAWNKWQVSSTHDSRPMDVKPADAKTHTLLDLACNRTEQVVGKDLVLVFAFPRTGVTYSQEVIGRARTEQAMDTSAHIVAIISDKCTYEDSDEVIGEIQFCYITGVLLGNIACQEQWAHIVKVIFRAFRLAMDMPLLFRKVIETIHTQLIYDEEGIEGSIFDHDVYFQGELKTVLTIFKSRLNEQLLAKGAHLTKEQSEVGKAFEELESWLWKWGWDLRGNYLRSGKIQLEDGEIVDAELKEFEAEDERGEYAPVIVDLGEDGRETGLIRW